MAVRDVLLLGNPLLWEKSELVMDIEAEEPRRIITDLSDTLRELHKVHGFGQALAAPQIGSLKRMIYIRMQPEGFCGVLINPVIMTTDRQRVEIWDDCFSLPDLMVRVLRFNAVTVQYFDEGGRKKTWEAVGNTAALLQHEIDHLDGILTVQRAVSPTAFALRSEWEKWFAGI
jgi:peptide deformylase